MKRWSTVQAFIANGRAPASETVTSFEGFASKGDGGASFWLRTGNTGAVSQSPINRGDNLLNDASGAEWKPTKGTTFYFDGANQWFPSPFGDSGVGLYQFNGSGWDYYEEAGGAVSIAITSDLIASSFNYDVGTALTFTGYSTPGDGGAAQWKKTALTGTPSQSPAQRGDGTLTDASEGLSDNKNIFAALFNSFENVDGGGRTYKVGAELDASKVKRLSNIIFDFTDAPSGEICLAAIGEKGSDVNLAGDVLKGEISITLENASEFSAGDFALLISDAIFDSSNTSSKIGEIVIISSVAGNVISVEDGVLDSYLTSDSASVSKLEPIRDLSFENVTVIGADGASGVTGILVKYGVNIKADKCEMDKTSRRGIVYDSCILSSVVNSYFHNFNDSTLAYGVSFMGPTRNSHVSGSKFRNCRHAFTTNNSDFSQGIGRFVSFFDNEVINSEIATGGSGGDAIDTHAGAEYVYIKNNVIYGSSSIGINFECASGAVSGNIIYDTEVDGIKIHNESDRQGSVAVLSNEIRRVKGRGIYFSNGTRGTSATYDRIKIEGNTTEDCAFQGVYLNGIGQTLGFASIKNNTIRKSSSEGIRCESSPVCSISGNEIHTDSTFAVRTVDSGGCLVNSNVIVNDSSSAAVYIQASGPDESSASLVSSNLVTSTSGATTEIAVLLSDDVTNTGVNSNQCIGTGGIDLGAGIGNIQSNNLT